MAVLENKSLMKEQTLKGSIFLRLRPHCRRCGSSWMSERSAELAGLELIVIFQASRKPHSDTDQMEVAGEDTCWRFRWSQALGPGNIVVDKWYKSWCVQCSCWEGQFKCSLGQVGTELTEGLCFGACSWEEYWCVSPEYYIAARQDQKVPNADLWELRKNSLSFCSVPAVLFTDKA